MVLRQFPFRATRNFCLPLLPVVVSDFRLITTSVSFTDGWNRVFFPPSSRAKCPSQNALIPFPPSSPWQSETAALEGLLCIGTKCNNFFLPPVDAQRTVSSCSSSVVPNRGLEEPFHTAVHPALSPHPVPPNHHVLLPSFFFFSSSPFSPVHGSLRRENALPLELEDFFGFNGSESLSPPPPFSVHCANLDGLPLPDIRRSAALFFFFRP